MSNMYGNDQFSIFDIQIQLKYDIHYKNTLQDYTARSMKIHCSCIAAMQLLQKTILYILSKNLQNLQICNEDLRFCGDSMKQKPCFQRHLHGVFLSVPLKNIFITAN